MAINYSNTIKNLEAKLARQESAMNQTREQIEAIKALQKYEATMKK